MNVSLIQESAKIHCEPGVPHFEGQLASTNFTAAMRISNCRGWLALLLSAHLNVFIHDANFYMKIHKSQFEQNKNVVVVVVVVNVVVVVVAVTGTMS